MGGRTDDVNVAADAARKVLGIGEAFDSHSEMESVFIDLTEHALHAFESAFSHGCSPVGIDLFLRSFGVEAEIAENDHEGGIIFIHSGEKVAALRLEMKVAVLIDVGNVTFGLENKLDLFDGHGASRCVAVHEVFSLSFVCIYFRDSKSMVLTII